tara:strand:+ start:4298 stop:4927 length:630 start_codon:yes stop_codon:yes gene_type:complete
MKNNIELLETFLSSNDKQVILINQVNEEIKFFYDYVIKYFSKNLGIKINSIDIKSNVNKSGSLFEVREVFIYSLTNSNQIKEISNINSNKIIFTDYKNYKKFKKDYVTINGYDYNGDIKYFFKNYFAIIDEKLVNYCTLHPYLIFSEISKYIINEVGYSAETVESDKTNFILHIRKEIFKLKNSEIDAKNLFFKLKDEAKYKKFNFLTF